VNGVIPKVWVGRLLFQHFNFEDELRLVDHVANIAKSGAKFAYL
jgi:hypothetical protein